MRLKALPKGRSAIRRSRKPPFSYPRWRSALRLLLDEPEVELPHLYDLLTGSAAIAARTPI
jgi:hypothetical protein